ncbi:MAG: sugar ABC transporter permease [Anaerolineae bacterium]|jgi:ABC-type sugar transport system permease subunit|nr:sugar ABC transporter permease [Anaerolineae bacterium]
MTANRLRRLLSLEMNETLLALVLIVPSLVVTLLLIFYPLVNTFQLSFYKSSLRHPERQRYIGLENYTDHLSDDDFWDSIERTAYFTFVSVGAELVLGIAVAMLLAQQLKGWRLVRLAVIIPWAVPTIVNGAIWRWIYNADYGALNGLLSELGLIDSYIPWLTSPKRAMNLVILADVWHSFPFVVLIVSAALSTLPRELYDAAAVDGANAFQRFFRITLPLLRPAILVVLVIRTVEAFRVFDIIYIITRGGPVNGTMVISYLTYQETFSSLRIGSGSALSFIVSAFILILSLIYIRLLYTENVT